MPRKKTKKQEKISKVMREFKEHKLHSGSKKGPEVTNPKQAIAIALSESRKVNKPMKKSAKRAKKSINRHLHVPVQKSFSHRKYLV